MIPEWLGAATDTGSLAEPAEGRPIAPAFGPGSARRSDYVERTLREAGAFVKEALFIERWARGGGALQQVDPRVKIICAALVLILVSSIHRQAVLWSLYAFLFAAALTSRIPAGLFLKRVWLFVPIFTSLVVLPATLNIITPGPALLTLFSPGIDRLGPWVVPPTIAITRSGIDAATLVVARVAASVSTVVLLTLTTRWADLLKALRAMKVSAVFVMVMEMSYRYVFVLVTMVEDTHLAKRARTIRRGATGTERRWVGSRIGATLRRSRKLTDAVYQAMVARGYDGEPRTLRSMRARPIDWIWLAGTIALVGGAFSIDRLVG